MSSKILTSSGVRWSWNARRVPVVSHYPNVVRRVSDVVAVLVGRIGDGITVFLLRSAVRYWTTAVGDRIEHCRLRGTVEVAVNYSI